MEELEKNQEMPNEEVKANPKKVEITLSSQMLSVAMAVVTVFLYVLCRILFNFGVGLGVFHAVMSIVVYCLPHVGMLLSYFSAKKFKFDFYLNAAVFALVMLSF